MPSHDTLTSASEKTANYVPFGEEWKKEVKKMSKDRLIELLRKKLIVQHNIIELINAYWRFDIHQVPRSTWGEKQHLIEKLRELLNAK